MTRPLPPLDGVERHPMPRLEWTRIVRRIRMPERLKGFAMFIATYAADLGTPTVWPEMTEAAAFTGNDEAEARRLLAVLCEEYGLLQLTLTVPAPCYWLTIPADLTNRFDLIPSTAGSDTRSVE